MAMTSLLALTTDLRDLGLMSREQRAAQALQRIEVHLRNSQVGAPHNNRRKMTSLISISEEHPRLNSKDKLWQASQYSNKAQTKEEEEISSTSSETIPRASLQLQLAHRPSHKSIKERTPSTFSMISTLVLLRCNSNSLLNR